jgi:hypothetical protein
MNIPYAQFRFDGEVVTMNKAQFDQAVRDGRLCKCGQCLACRAWEYLKDSQEDER